MMKKLLCVSILLLGAVAASAQGSNGGVLYASDFANWSLPQANTPAFGQIQWTSSQICQVSATGYTFTGPKTGRPVRIVDANSSLSETVTPTNVIVNGGFCSLTASMANAHYTYHVGSGTAGLQEAIDYQSGLAQGSVVVLTPAWTLAGGTTGMITAARGNANVSILDERTNTFTAYSWNGSAYVVSPFISTGCLGGNSVANGCTGATSQPAAFNNVVAPGGAMTGALSTPSLTANQEQVNGPKVSGALCAYGDSITAQLSASSQSGVWEYWLGRAFGFTTYNYGVGSQTSWTTDQFIFNTTCPPIGQKQLVTYMIGTNNVGLIDPLFPTGFTADGVTNYQINIEAQYAWLALGGAPAIKFGSTGGISFAGSWSSSNQINHDPGKQCTGLTCAATFTGTGTTLYLATAAINGGSATGTLTCDGNPTGATLNFFPVGSYNTASNFTALTRVTGLSNTLHSCTVQNTSSGLISLEWAQFLNGANPVAAAPVVLTESILDRSTSNYPVDVTTPAYRAVQGPSVTLLAGDGLTNLIYQDNTGILNNWNYASDGLHPIDYGHWLIAQNSIGVLNTKYGLSQIMPTYSYAYVAQGALYGADNFCVGLQCLAALPNSALAGGGNTAAGVQVLEFNTTGVSNTAVGEVAMKFNVDGGQNVAFGSKAVVFNVHGSNLSGFGYHALENATAGPNDAFGSLACDAVTTGIDNICFGYLAGTTMTTSSFTLNIGYEAGQNNITDNNMFVGVQAGQTNTTGSLLTGVGFQSLQANTTGASDTGIGYKTLLANTTGSNNFAGGPAALSHNTTGGSNIGIGVSSLQTNVSGNSSVAVGVGALQNSTVGPNTAVGASAGTAITTGVNDSMHGFESLKALTTATDTTAIGYRTGLIDTTGGFNTLVGSLAGYTSTPANGNVSGANDTWVGYNSGPSSTTQVSNSFGLGNGAQNSASNQGVIGNSSVTDVWMGGLTGAAIIHGASLSLAAARKGTFTCTAGGTITITNANELTTSDVVISLNTAGGTIATPPAMKTVTNATGFTVLCAAADTSVYNYLILD